MTDDPIPPRKIIPIEDLRREAAARRGAFPGDEEGDELEPDEFAPEPESFDDPEDDVDATPATPRPDATPPGLWDRVGDVHPGFTYLLVLTILIGFAAQLVTAGRGAGVAVVGGSLVGPFVTAGAALRAPFLEGEWWRALAPVFLHANILHLVSNLIALVIVGGVVERVYGHARFLVIFVAATLVGSLATFEHQNLMAGATLGSIGASGAVYGVGAAVVAAAVRLRGLLSPWRARALIGATMPLLLSSLAGGFARPGTDNAAHLGGVLAGAVLGAFLPFHAALQPAAEPATARTLWAIAGVIGLSALLSAGIVAFQHGMLAS